MSDDLIRHRPPDLTESEGAGEYTDAGPRSRAYQSMFDWEPPRDPGRFGPLTAFSGYYANTVRPWELQGLRARISFLVDHESAGVRLFVGLANPLPLGPLALDEPSPIGDPTGSLDCECGTIGWISMALCHDLCAAECAAHRNQIVTLVQFENTLCSLALDCWTVVKLYGLVKTFGLDCSTDT
jgi:hypothetical protein